MNIDIPSYGVGIWVEGDNFVIRFPDQQLISIPVNESQRLASVLRHRESMVRAQERPSIGTLGAPVQYDIDRIAEHLTRKDEEEKARKRAISLAAKRIATKKRLAKEALDRERAAEADELLAYTGLLPKPQSTLHKRA